MTTIEATRSEPPPGDASAYTVRLDRVHKRYGPTVAVREISLEVGSGEFVCLLGPSGCGKTTTLRMIAGFIRPTAGQISIGGRVMNDVPPYARNCGMVFQNYALFPHLSAFDNVAYGLKIRRIGREETTRRVTEALERVRMVGRERHFPRQLSGGQQQRIALARALVVQPSVLLLDEPLSNLDARLRVEMREEIRSLVKSIGITTVFVTHDQEESLTMADRIVVMNHGVVEQVGSAADVYERPETLFVATFVGTTNVFRDLRPLGPGGSGRELVEAGGGRRLEGRPVGAALPDGPLAYTVRPERVAIGPRDRAGGATDGPNRFDGRVVTRTYIGSIIRYRIMLDDGTELVADQQNRDATELREGDEAAVWWDAGDGLIVAAGEAGL